MKLRVEWFSGTGKGGQHRNKHQNCCRLVDEETGISANGTRNRSREANRRDAEAVLKARLYAHYHTDTERYRAGSERVRTYHYKDNRVIDHASGLTVSIKEAETDFGRLIEARRMALVK